MRFPRVFYALLRLLAGASLVLAASATLAEPYPSKPVRIIVNVPPGANSDIIARQVADRLGKDYGQRFVVENRPGAGGDLGISVVARANADGYTLLFTHSGPIVLGDSEGGAPDKLLAPVSVVASMPYLLLGHPKLPAKSVGELLAYAKARPDGLLIANQSPGSDIHLLLEVFGRQSGSKYKLVPYQGGAPALKDVIGGHVDLIFTSNVKPYIKPGLLHPFAVATDRRWARYPDVPTLKEQGIDKVEGTAWWGLFAPAGTPVAIRDELNRRILQAFDTPAAREQMANTADADVVTQPLAQTEAFVAAERRKWQAALQQTGVALR